MWVNVQSSNIDAVGYQDNRLFIRFHGGAEYAYDKVPREVFQEIVRAESVGSCFHNLIKKRPEKYPYRRLN